MRGGAFKPRTSPYSFQGLGVEGLEILAKVRKETGMPVVTEALDIDVVIFDNELSPAQQRNLAKMFQCDVVDRVALILDIFAQHASSKEGMLQVIRHAFDELGLPPVIRTISNKSNGLVLVTGPTGSGKSTTIASSVDSSPKIEQLHCNRPTGKISWIIVGIITACCGRVFPRDSWDGTPFHPTSVGS